MAYDIEQLRVARDRVSELTGPDRVADALIYNIIEPKEFGEWISQDDPWCNDEGDEEAPNITESIDAVEALRQMLLPGWLVQTTQFKNVWECEIARYQIGDGWRGGEANAPTEPLARLLALLDTLIAQGEE